MTDLADVRAALGSTDTPGPGLVIETSGSAAAPKRVRLGPHALRASANAVHERLGGPGQWLLALPTTYVAGANVLARSVIAQTQPVVMPPGPFTVEAFVGCVERMTGARRYTALVPVQLARLLSGAQNDPRVRASIATLDAILVGGQASGEQQLARARELGWNVVETYGSTETCGGVVYDGHPLDGVRVRIVDGEIWLGGDTLATGYENADGSSNAELTAAEFVEVDGQRWYRTDDAGELTENSRLVVTGRRDRVIISGGIKISLVAIEEVVRAVPGVEDALAVGVDDKTWGQRPLLGIERAAGADLSHDDVVAVIERELGHICVPDQIVIGELPRNTNGKPDARAFAAAHHR